MSLKTLAVSLPLLWGGATALPAGPGFWPDGPSPSASPPNNTFHTSSAYNLIDTYDASNWLSKFNVQDVSYLTHVKITHN
jgi:hypothetical protein